MLIENLQQTSCYPHSVKEFRVIETHISWVILTGEVAYKIKKPVNFGFLDFSSLEQRKFYCEEELKLGQTLSAHLYLAVLPITGSISQPQLEGNGEVIEYAIKMKQFPQDALLDRLLHQGKVTDSLISALAKQVAQFHRHTSIVTSESRFGSPDQVHAPVLQNFEQMLPLEQDPVLQARLNALLDWSQQQFTQWQALFKARKEQGFIRDCHGDLHLANIIYHENHITLFDRIEFNEDFRWTDVFADLAFLMMDLIEKGYPEFATQLLNEYLMYTRDPLQKEYGAQNQGRALDEKRSVFDIREHHSPSLTTSLGSRRPFAAGLGDYQGIGILPYYVVYRAMVRAKIALFRKTHDTLSVEAQNSTQETYLRYLAVAEQYAHRPSPELVITHGFSGSGKTTQAHLWAKTKGAIHLRSDIVRKQLFDLDPHAQLNAPLYGAHYNAEATEKTYQKLQALAESALQAGYSVVVDACFLTQAQRTPFYQLAENLKCPCGILASQPDIETLKKRIKSRRQKENDVSEARIDILEAQMKVLEPLNSQEQEKVV